MTSPPMVTVDAGIAAGYVFLCSDETEGECLQRELFGLGAKYLKTMQQISVDTQVRKPPSWPSTAFSSCVPTVVYGPTCILWVNLTPLSL